MNATTGRIAVAALIVGVALAVAPAPIFGGRAGADPIGRCTTTSGAVVAVDFGHWGGPIVRGCGVGSASGYELLHAAGFATSGDSHDGPGYICRIGNQAFASATQYPTPSADACIVTPPVTAYWSYWVAPPGQGTWSYSRVGAMGGAPRPGEVDLWEFGATDLGGTSGSAVPSLSPDSLRAHNTAPTGVAGGGTRTTLADPPPTRVSPPPTSSGPSGPGEAPVPTGAGPGATAPGVSTAAGTRPVGTAISVPPATAPTGAKPVPVTSAARSNAAAKGDSASAPRVVDALPAVHDNGSSGSIGPVLIGLALLLALGAGTAATMWRRRRLE